MFNNFPVSGQISAFQVNSGYSASNSFTLPSSSTIGEFNFGAWVTTGDSVNGVAWSIGISPFDTSLASGVAGATSTYDLSNVDGFDVNIVSFAIPSLTLPAGTYYLTLSGATSAGGNPVYWDINDGAGIDAWDSTYGHVSAPNVCFQTVGISGTCASSFQILSTGTALTALPASLTFSNQLIDTTSSAQGVTITNNGAGTATINGIAITGVNPGSFAQTNNCPISPATLASSGACTINVTLTPTVASALSASVTITGTNPVSVPLSGTGTQIPSNVTLLPNSLTFAGQTVNTPSGTQTIALTNNGPSPLTISSVAITGANSGDFAQANNCPISPATLAANNSCLINVMFTPQASGARSAAVSITDNGNGSPQSAGLSGTGVAPPPSWPNGYTYQATFTVAAGKVPSAQTSFPALISGTYSDFATTANGGRVINTCTQVVGNNSTAVPCDLIFTSDAAGTQLLSWEFETWTAATGAVNIWVNVPNLTNGTIIYAWYGHPSVTTLQTTPSATWTNYMAVYHMKENPAGAGPQLNDSTGSGNNATMNGPVVASQQQPGEIDGSINFEGNTWAGLASSSSFSFERTDSFSISAWYKIPTNTSGVLLSKIPQPMNAGWELAQFAGGSSPQIALGLFGTNVSTGALVETPAVSMGAWHYVVATYSGTGTVAGMNIYIDGVKQSLITLENNLATRSWNQTIRWMSFASRRRALSTPPPGSPRVTTTKAVRELSLAWQRA
ncbi:MAG: choice-of-anchor D domain-containing protein [Terracidiphilus sp.]